MSRWSFACLVIAGASTAMAKPTTYGTQRISVVTTAPRLIDGPRVLYLNRCIGGCTINAGDNDAALHTSSLPIGNGPFNVGAYAWGDAEWAQVVECVREVYSPYALTLTDTRPTSGSYAEELIAGLPGDIGYKPDVLGIANIEQHCNALDNVMSFVFANNHPPNDRVNNVCWTAAQEAAHIFGLDHEYQFIDQSSACTDPMTYRTDCGGRKFFRDHDALCGEYSVRDCHCGGVQNSHRQLLGVFGPGTPITAPPTSSLTSPTDGSMLAADAAILAAAGSPRGIGHVDLYLNESWWLTVPGVPFGPTGQDNPSTYELDLPAGVPDSTIDIVAKAFDDLETETNSATVTVTKGAPCVTADTCAAEQVCTSGRCMWGPPTGVIGDACTYPQACVSHVCDGIGSDQICTQSCTPGGLGSSADCPGGYSCTTSSTGNGICYYASGGCCSAGGGDAVWWHLGVCGIVLASILRRRRA